MGKTSSNLIILILLAGLVNSCTPRHSNILSLGELQNPDFRDTVTTEVRNGLIIVPVVIKGKTYRFLFDSGAPLSISHELQEEFSFKRVSTGKITDSDQNRMKIEYVSLDTIRVGDIPFTNQSAFVADFKANPILGCLELDGILGSNLMRYCNWIIDYESARIVLTSEIDSIYGEDVLAIPFTPDKQYDIHVDLNIGRARVSDLEVDYGSTGSLLLPAEVFETLKSDGIIEKTFLKVGEKQSGLIGEAVQIKRELAYTDSVELGNIRLDDVLLRSGHKGLIGQDILSRFIVSIDWGRQVLFLENKHKSTDPTTYGFGLWPAKNDQGLVVQNLIKNGPAERAGLELGSLVVQINHLNFSGENGFCDYIRMVDTPTDSLRVTFAGPNGLSKTVTINKEKPGYD
jgi:hypothetical protein